MKFHFKNLGTIKKTTLDLRPLTVIVGPNNTSKTYLAYCVHGLIHSAGVRQRPSFGGLHNVRFSVADVYSASRDWVKQVANDFVNELSQYFQDTHGGLFKGTFLGIELDDEDLKNAIERLVTKHPGEVEFVGKELGVWARSSEAGHVLLSVATLVAAEALRVSLTLPAERNAFIITYKILHARRYRILRDLQRLPQLELFRQPADIRYPSPIEYFFDFLTDVEMEQSGSHNGPTSPFGKLAVLIENHIQGGHRTEYRSTELSGRELMVTVNDGLRIDLYNASSSIKQLAPLLLYLRYRAEPNQVLIIDEPEMNLHPEAQAKLLEALGMLANLGVHVLLTTHSPYFMAHLNNLIASDQKSAARKKRQAKHLYMGDPAAFLSPDDVSAYEMRPEGLVSLADPEYGIRWDTLSDVSGELQRRHFAIVEEPASRGKAKS